jgi:hypothetical protein
VRDGVADLSFGTRTRRHLPSVVNLTSPDSTTSIISRHQDTTNSNMSSQDAAVRHQAVVPDKIPTGEYPVSPLAPKHVLNGWK